MEKILDLLVIACKPDNLAIAITALTAAILAGLFYIVYHVVKLVWDRQQTLFPHKQKVNETALDNLYGPLYLYVFKKQNLQDYSPKEAKQFVKDLKAIISKNPYYADPFLDEKLADLEKALIEKKPKYTAYLEYIRSHIITLYDAIRKQLYYPKTSALNNFITTSSMARRGVITAYFFSLISSIFFLLFCTVMPEPPQLGVTPTAEILAALTLFLIANGFIIAALIMLIISIIYKSKASTQKKQITAKWFTPEGKAKVKPDKSSKKHLKKCSP